MKSISDILGTHAAPRKKAPREDERENPEIAALFEDVEPLATDLLTLSSLYREAEAEVKEAEEALRSAQSGLDNARTALREAIVMLGLDSIRNQYGTFTPGEVYRVSIPKHKEEEAYEFFRSINLGGIIKTKTSIHPSTLTAQVTQLLEDDVELPEAIKVFPQKVLRQQKPKANTKKARR
jgi:hypothetical protein